MNRKFITGLGALAVIFAVTSLGAQDPNYVFDMGSAAGVTGSTVNAGATFTNNGTFVSGWSYGICTADETVAVAVAVFGEETNTINGGAMPGFQSLNIQIGGWTQGVVIDLFGANPIPPGGVVFMASANYDLIGAPGTTTALDFCGTLGPVAVTVVVVVNGLSLVPTASSGNLTILTDPCDLPLEFAFIAPTAGPINYPATAGNGGVAFSADFSLHETTPYPAGVPCGAETQGFSMGVSHDPTLMTVTAAASAGSVAALNGGGGPAFETAGILANGWTIGIVYSLQPPVSTIVFATPQPVVTADYVGAGALVGVAGPTSTPLNWDSTLGAVPVANVVVVGGGSVGADFNDGSVTFNGTTTNPFVGGDCNGDGIINIADIIWALSELFSGGPTRNCPIACDANGDGSYGIADPIYIANYVFLLGPPPAGNPTCGTVPGQTPEDCDPQAACP